MENGKTDLERLDDFLIYLANKENIGVRRKIVALKQFINRLIKKQKNEK